MDIDPGDLEKLLAHIDRTLSKPLKEWPGGRRGQIESALIDAVLSIRARYGRPASGNRPASGVYKAIERYRGNRSGELDDLQRLASADPEELADLLGTHQLTGGNPKANAIVQAATNLVAVGVHHAEQFDVDDPRQEAAYCRVQGLGWVTWSYLGMLLGQQGVKADTWVLAFVADALGRPVDPKPGAALVRAAAAGLTVEAVRLDHAIWDYMRSRPGE